MIKIENIFLNQTFATKEQVFDFLSEQMVALGYGTDESKIKASLDERESLSTTGMMDGFAIPHAKTDAINEASVLIVKNTQGIEWASLDGQPIDFVVGLFIPENEAGTTHLQILSKISRLLMNEEKKIRLKKASSAQDIYDVLVESIGMGE